MSKTLKEIMEDMSYGGVTPLDPKVIHKFDKLRKRQRKAFRLVSKLERSLKLMDAHKKVYDRYAPEQHVPFIDTGMDTAVLIVHCDEDHPQPFGSKGYTGLVVGELDSIKNDGHHALFVTFIDDGGAYIPKNNAAVSATDFGRGLQTMSLPVCQEPSLIGLVEVCIPQTFRTALLDLYDAKERSKRNGTKQRPEESREKPAKTNKTKKCSNRCDNSGTEVSNKCISGRI